MKNLKIISSGIAMLVFYLCALSANAQTVRTITGTVSDETGPIPGANITVRGTIRNTQSNIDGKYAIAASEGEVLVYSYVGMTDYSVTVAKQTQINVVLHGGSELNEIVVTATGVRRKSEAITGSNTVKKGYRNANNVNKMADKVSGLQISTTSLPAAATESRSVTFRGNPTASSQKDALIIIDGKIATRQEFEKIAKTELVSIDALKSEKATAIYGSDGLNGAIVISTIRNPNPRKIPNDESYDEFVENPFESPQAAPLSTFSIDVDNASYTNIRRFINNGQPVPKDAVRVEEMVNFFKYQYPQPVDQNPFSINTEFSGCPWNPNHKLLRIGLQGKNIPLDDLPSSNLVFLIDVSGSMDQENKLPLLVQSMKILVNELRKNDKVSIVVYAGAAGMVLAPTSGAEKQTIIDALENLQAGGSTAGGAGIELAYKLAAENFVKNGNNRVILATDGDFNVGSSSDKDMQTLIEEKRKSGVFLTCLGYGMGNYKDSKLEILADKGNGNYAYIDNIQEANRFLSKEFKGSMFAIAKDVKIQIEFNPKYVQNYRLIGYENRKLRPEDFNNDVIDAGELGSGHTVTALYEVIPVGVTSSFASSVDDLKYSQNPVAKGVENGQLAFIKFRYKKPDGEKSILMTKEIADKPSELQTASADFKFTAAVAWFGLKLRDSKLISDKSSDAVRMLARAGLTSDTEGYKAEFVRLVETNVAN